MYEKRLNLKGNLDNSFTSGSVNGFGIKSGGLFVWDGLFLTKPSSVLALCQGGGVILRWFEIFSSLEFKLQKPCLTFPPQAHTKRDHLNTKFWIYQLSENQLQHKLWHLRYAILWLLTTFLSTLAAPGHDSASYSTQLPNRWVFLPEAQAQCGSADWCCSYMVLLHRVTHAAHFPLCCSLHIKLRGSLRYVSVGIVRDQMTSGTSSPPPAVNSLQLDPENHLPSAALHCNALPHGLITATLFQL